MVPSKPSTSLKMPFPIRPFSLRSQINAPRLGGPIPKEWLSYQVAAQTYLAPAKVHFRSFMRKNDEIWRFRNPSSSGSTSPGSDGYAPVRNGKVIKSAVTNSLPTLPPPAPPRFFPPWKTIPKEWLEYKVTAKFQLDIAKQSLRTERKNDEIWRFRSPHETWTNSAGRAGFALVRNGKIIQSVDTESRSIG